MRLVEMVLEALGHPTDRFTFGVLADDNKLPPQHRDRAVGETQTLAITETK